MVVAALVVSIVSALAAAVGLLYARQSVQTARGSEQAAKESADAARKQAEIWAAHLEIEQRRSHREMAQVLAGIVKKHPVANRPGIAAYRLEVYTKTPQPMTSITLRLPADSWVRVTQGPLGIGQDLHYPEPGEPGMKVEPTHPASWDVEIVGSPVGIVTAAASCRTENGQSWDGVEVPISMGEDSTSLATN
jgi:hypothetical protein